MLVDTVVRLGEGAFTADDVRNCITHLWESGGKYDSVEALLEELDNGLHRKCATQQSQLASEAISYHTSCEYIFMLIILLTLDRRGSKNLSRIPLPQSR